MIADITIKSLQRQASISPIEICGIIASNGKVYPISNASATPHQSFVFNKRDYVEAHKSITAAGESIYCVYHSHPTGNGEPSKADLAYLQKAKVNGLIVTKNSFRWLPYE